MRKTYYPLRKEYPQLNLKIEITDTHFTFSGNKTPDDMIGVFTRYLNDNHSLAVISSEYSEVYVTSTYIHLCIGGRALNSMVFKKTYSLNQQPFSRHSIEHVMKILKSIEIPQLNKQIKVL